jgi:hypothetical protein
VDITIDWNYSSLSVMVMIIHEIFSYHNYYGFLFVCVCVCGNSISKGEANGQLWRKNNTPQRNDAKNVSEPQRHVSGMFGMVVHIQNS